MAITTVKLLNVPLENDYLHTFYFANTTEQLAYFNSKVVRTSTDFTYQRKDNIIRFPLEYDALLNVNYVMYQNSAYSNKWFYAFITDIRYINDGITEIKIETDVLQTWQEEYTLKSSFVEREHVETDVIGEHTVPEQVELGDYKCNVHNKAGYTSTSGMIIVVGVTKTADGNNVRGTLYNNIYSGVKYYTFPNTTNGATALETFLSTYAGDGASDAITCMFLAPANLTYVRSDNTIAGTNTPDTHYINVDSSLSINTTLALTTNTLDGYNPKNNKLKTFPYRYLCVSNNSGASVPYKYEEFYTISGNTKTMNPPQFEINGCLCPGCSVRMIPKNYKGIERYDEEGINLGKYPILNWTSDVYTNWLTQNGVNVGLSIAGSVLQVAGGVALASTGAGALMGAGAISSGVLGVASTLGEVYQHSLVPPQSEGNINSGDVITCTGDNDFHFYDMTIKKEYAQIIDNYFTMYGYKVNRVKVPSHSHRSRFWYIKTIDVNIDGAIPNVDMQKIKDCYNRGITFWKDRTNFQDYTIDNTITG